MIPARLGRVVVIGVAARAVARLVVAARLVAAGSGAARASGDLADRGLETPADLASDAAHDQTRDDRGDQDDQSYVLGHRLALVTTRRDRPREAVEQP